ncbi:MAG TPA: single-stranded-DNA-specific exonuclease RecJ [Syntrophales bacterium]|nr:single-stranded-DNA-specific exonuclease RecJ [Syntrophales bacterium]HOL58517.1 single-stranded-DNA-specific exonuclease RecJ [Syntrophales bacterium]HPO34875.1 single-stranded-DNA-specific exonuclease RecJ [Syntrophales bacterium]
MTKVLSLPLTKWKFRDEKPAQEEALKEELRIRAVLSSVLVRRGISEPDLAQKFLHPSLHDLHPPLTMAGMKVGVERVLRALYNKEKILIYGDYDADGITGVAIILKFLRELTPQVEYYIPDRIEEGYGLSRSVIDRFQAEGGSLIITVDCGISDFEAVSHARNIGVDTIILDHHEVPPTLPPAVAIINPKQSSCRFPFKQLAAVGIAFNFLIALRGKLRSLGFWTHKKYPNLKEYLDLVALGTIGDICPLTDENRIMAKVGLNLLTEGHRTGIKALKEIAGLGDQAIDANRASYGLIPRINAAGRVGSARDAVELLLCEDYTTALELARKLEVYNRQRQAMEREILEEIMAEVNCMEDFSLKKSLVLASPNWHPGIIGIVASRLVDRFGRPAILISLKDGIGKGSGRSVMDFNIYEGLKRCASLLISFGGHQYAAGISIREEDVAAFSRLLDEVIEESALSINMKPQTYIDAHCHLRELDYDLIEQLNLLAPFGQGNPEPILWAKGVNITDVTVVGNNHLRLKVKDDHATTCNSIWFNQGELCGLLGEGRSDIAFTPQLNEWNGFSEVQLMLRDISLREA